MNAAANDTPTDAAAEATRIVFVEGIIGVPRARTFEFLEAAGSPIHVLRCLEIEGFALPVCDPRLADPDYAPTLGERIHKSLGLAPGDPVLLLAVTTRDPSGPHCNLRAPIVVNVRHRRAMQVILDDRSLPLRAPIRPPT